MRRVTIVGGGPAGCATALALHARGVRDVTVVEAGAYAGMRIGESVPPDIHRLFAQLGILGAFLAEGHEPCVGSCSAWGSERLGFNDFVADPHGPGWHLDRSRFEAFLARQVIERGMRVLTHTRFRNVERTADVGFRLTLGERNGDTLSIECDHVIDAGGVQALLATRLGARKRIVDRLLMVCAFVELEVGAALSRLTLLEASEYGWWYAAKLPQRRAIVAVASDAATLKTLRLDETAAWQRHLAETLHLSVALGRVRMVSDQLDVLLAASSLLEPVAARGWLAVGDAASCFDPISAQGIHKAFANAIAAADVIAGSDEHDTAEQRVQRYQQGIRRDFANYLRLRQHFYDIEQRWPQSSFWKTRHTQVRNAAA
jgi:flavin-dependent dehydrogenase